MKKNFVLDTNIIIHNPNCFDKFEENNIYIPFPVVEELDGKKNEKSEAGYSAREGTRRLMEFRDKGLLRDGVATPGGGKIYLYMDEDFGDDFIVPKGWNMDKMDNLILLSAMKLSKEKKNVILVTNDANMTLKADILGIRVQEYKNDRIADGVTIYKGRSKRHTTNKNFEKLMSGGISVQDLAQEDQIPAPMLNEFITVTTWDEKGSCLAKYDGMKIRKLDFKDTYPMDLATRNAGQVYLKEALMSSYKDHPLTICMGPAGTGKTLFAIACGLEQVMEMNRYKRVLVCRSNVMMDEEIGYLPGSEQDKISPLLRGVYDNLEVIFGKKFKDDEDISRKGGKGQKNGMSAKEKMDDVINEMFFRGYIEAQAVSYLRGRSITNTYIIIDEVQNCTPNQILSIITRAGEGSKIVLLGDTNQIDNTRLDKRNNGLVYALERMKGDPLCEVITFDETECTRSALAKSASDKLKK